MTDVLMTHIEASSPVSQATRSRISTNSTISTGSDLHMGIFLPPKFCLQSGLFQEGHDG